MAVANSDGNDRADTPGTGYQHCSAGWNMMFGPGDWTPATMESHMRAILGNDEYREMIDSMRSFRHGRTMMGPGNNRPDWMPFAGMMGTVSEDEWERCWAWMDD